MSQMTYSSPAERIGRIKGAMLRHAVPVEVLGITGTHRMHPKNSSKTVVHRRWLPYGGALTNATTINQWSVDPAAHETSEGITPNADTLTPQDITVVLKEYACLYQYTNQVADLYEDDVPAEQLMQAGERMGLVREMVRYGVLKGCTNKFYAGGSSRSTVSSSVTLPTLRLVARSLRGNRGRVVKKILAPSAEFNTAPIEAAFLVFSSTDCESNIRDLPGFIACAQYGSRQPVHEHEIGSVESFRFVISPELGPIPDSGAAVGSTGLESTSGTLVNVFPMIVVAEDAWADVALRGTDSFRPTHLPAGKKDKSDPLGQRGYVGSIFYDAAFIQNDGWMAVLECGVADLTA